jgi:hypothetical protein
MVFVVVLPSRRHPLVLTIFYAATLGLEGNFLEGSIPEEMMGMESLGRCHRTHAIEHDRHVAQTPLNSTPSRF